MLAPQSEDDVRPIELAIRRELDDRLRIKWNPRALITRPGYIDANGKTVPPEHDGRWTVVIERPNEPDHCLYLVRWDGDGNEAYRPIGPWLLEFLRQWDRANAHAADELQRMLREEERLEQEAQNDEDEEHRDFWERAGFILGKEELIGRGFGSGTTTRDASRTHDDVSPATQSGDVSTQEPAHVESLASA